MCNNYLSLKRVKTEMLLLVLLFKRDEALRRLKFSRNLKQKRCQRIDLNLSKHIHYVPSE